MELDKRIKEGKRPLTAFDVMESKFIGTDCYFSDKASDYGDLSNCQIGRLLSRDGMTGVFNATKNNSYANFDYCLPCEWVEEKKESEYRPYTLTEFLNKFTIGRPIKFKRKSNSDHEHLLMFGGYITHDDGDIEIILGRYSFALMELFKYYEWQDSNGNWQPFGVLEE